jgi:hypothetical protein
MKHRNHQRAAEKRRMSFFFRDLADLRGWKNRPRNGKVARLPEPIRLAINHMLDDGLPYRAILAHLRDHSTSALQPSIVRTPESQDFGGSASQLFSRPVVRSPVVSSSPFQHFSVSASQLLLSLSEQNLSNWFHGGYQDWLRDELKRQALTPPLCSPPPHLACSPSASCTKLHQIGPIKGLDFAHAPTSDLEPPTSEPGKSTLSPCPNSG